MKANGKISRGKRVVTRAKELLSRDSVSDRIRTGTLVTADAAPALALYRTYMNTSQTEERIKSLVSKFPSAKAVADGRLVGFCYTDSFSPDVLEIANIYVDSGFQNRGIGSDLLYKIENDALKAGFVATILSNSSLYETDVTKKSPRTFYERHGYVEIFSTASTLILAKRLG